MSGVRRSSTRGPSPSSDVIDLLNVWLQEQRAEEALFCSWGGFDHRILQRDCLHHHVPYPFSDQHCNLKSSFLEKQDISGRMGLASALRHAGLTFQGSPHRGIDDARNIARLLPWCL